MALKKILVGDNEYYPVQVYNSNVVNVYLYDCDADDLVDDFDNQQPVSAVNVNDLTCEELNIAVYNFNFINFRDMINIMQLDTNGIIWQVSPMDDSLVVDWKTNEDVLRAVDGPYATNNATVAATAKDSLAALIGVYYRIHSQGNVSIKRKGDRLILDYILQILRKAGVKNVQDFEYQ